MGSTGRFIIAALAAVLLTLFTPSTASALTIPERYEVVSSEQLAPGLDQLTLQAPEPAQSVHVARIAEGAEVGLRAMASNGSVAGRPRLERTSSMCARVQCLVAINGDFAFPSSGEPVGGLVSYGELVRSPNNRHHQLVVGPEGDLASGPLEWRGELVSTDLQRLALDGVNVSREEDDVVLYTPTYARSTRTNPHGVELALRTVRPEGPIRLGQTSAVRILEIRRGEGNARIPPDGAVLSGHGAGAAALEDLWRRIEDGTATRDALLRLETDPEAAESVGGSPILVREGRRWFTDVQTTFVRGRHPRTIVGWTPEGETLLVTVDGRQSGSAEGMSLAEAADLMIALGATEAINLDGGGSTTFSVRGDVTNRPSDRMVNRRGRQMLVPRPRAGDDVVGHVERPVTAALAVVPISRLHVEPADPGPADLELPQAISLRPPVEADPASDPVGAGALPALVIEASPTPPDRTLPIAAAVVALAGAVVLVDGRRNRS